MADWPAIEITRGDTYEEYFKIFDGNDAAMDLSGCTVWWTVKESIDDDDTDATAIIKHYIVISGVGAVTGSSGFALGGVDPETDAIVSTALSGVLTHTVSSSDTTDMELGAYVYDIQVKTATGRIKTIVNNASFGILGDVTRRETTP